VWDIEGCSCYLDQLLSWNVSDPKGGQSLGEAADTEQTTRIFREGHI